MNQNPQAPESRKRATATTTPPVAKRGAGGKASTPLVAVKIGGVAYAEVSIDNQLTAIDESAGHFQAAPIPQHPVEHAIPPAAGAPPSTKSWTPPGPTPG